MESENPSTLHLYYWNIRGLAAYDQLALEAAGVKYEYHGYTEASEEEWFKRDKPALTMTLPNLPYFQDGTLLVSEHDAIFRHVLRKYKPEMLGTTLEEQALVDQFISFWMKTNGTIRDFCYDHKDPTTEDRMKLIESFSAPLTRIEALLASQKFHIGE